MQLEMVYPEADTPVITIRNPIPSVQKLLESSNQVQKDSNTYKFIINLNQIDDLGELIKCFDTHGCQSNDIIQKILNDL